MGVRGYPTLSIWLGVVLAGGWSGQRPTILRVLLDGLLDQPAEFGKDGLFIVAVAPTVEQARAAANEALVFFGPLNDLDVACCDVHRCDSSMARRSTRSW